MKRVLIIQEHMPAFRVGFYEILREKLAENGIVLDLIYAPNQRNTFLNAEVDWAIQVPLRWIAGRVGWQPVLKHCRGKDLVVVQQEIKYLVNPVLQLWSKLGGPKVAYWGHGRNFQSSSTGSIGDRFKACLSKHVDWWFPYNTRSGDVVRAFGFPAGRITEVMNSIDTTLIRKVRGSTSMEDLARLKDELGITSSKVAVYTGGLYKAKRIEFLIEAALFIRQQIPDFHLIVIGDGRDADLVIKAASAHYWIHPVGAKTDTEKVPYWMLAKLLLIPGLVGLVIVDSFALGVPLITTDYPFHSPEIDYLRDGENGLRVNCGDDAGAYANAVVRLLEDGDELARLAENAEADGGRYSFEAMATNFADGVIRCLPLSQIKRIQPSGP
jgi:glycosyltransferase involved in cell wall biosynthesis